MDRTREHEGLAEPTVEPQCDVPRDLHVLTLVVAHGDLLGVVEQDVSRHESRIGEQPGGDELGLAFVGLVLELGHPAQLAVGHHALHDPRQFGVFVYVALHENRRHIGVESDGEECRGELDGLSTDDARTFRDREGMEIDDPVEDVLVVLTGDPVGECAEIVPEVDGSRRLDAGEDPRHGPER